MRDCKGWSGGRRLRGALGLSALALLSGCGWFDSGVKVDMGKLRPGAERDISPSAALPPPPSGHPFDAPISPVEETASSPKIGSVVAESGGQKAQLEKQEKEEAARAAEELKDQDRAIQQEKLNNARDAALGTPASTTPSSDNLPPGPPTEPVAPARAPVTGTPVPPPATDAAPSNTPSGSTTDTKPAGS
jgi:hypothetical protein